MPGVELKRHLQSLACAKYKILKKHPPGREIEPSDSFSFNHDFTCPTLKIKISTVSAKVETTEERKETKERIDEERQYQMEVRHTDCFSYDQTLIPYAGMHCSRNERSQAYDPYRSDQ